MTCYVLVNMLYQSKAFQKTRLDEQDNADFDDMVDALDECLEMANLEKLQQQHYSIENEHSAGHSGDARRPTSAATSPEVGGEKKEMQEQKKTRKKRRVRQRLHGPLQRVLKAREMYPTFVKWMSHACCNPDGEGAGT